MFANIGDLTSNVISSEKNLPLPISICCVYIFEISSVQQTASEFQLELGLEVQSEK